MENKSLKGMLLFLIHLVLETASLRQSPMRGVLLVEIVFKTYIIVENIIHLDEFPALSQLYLFCFVVNEY